MFGAAANYTSNEIIIKAESFHAAKKANCTFSSSSEEKHSFVVLNSSKYIHYRYQATTSSPDIDCGPLARSLGAFNPFPESSIAPGRTSSNGAASEGGRVFGAAIVAINRRDRCNSSVF
ncbi:hypothetical protein ROHU_017248 [Labeo rohita]|uniref:Uncharacterized protein n=1 Tax=Labeo rohita TaxID=84645 RepID=A0A498NH65_LABRO|nr:hypothetical protein ROHU_017248 [Labeo rohita]